MSQDARETESEKSIRNTLNKPWRVNYLQAEIMIIDPKPYQNTHFFIYHWEFTMDLSRVSQTSTNTAEFEHQY